MATAFLIFGVTYALITCRRLGLLRVSRPAAAWAGAAATVVFGVLTPSGAYENINGDTIVLLAALMILAGHLDHAGFFEWGASVTLRLSRDPGTLLTVIVFASGLLSAFLVNDTVCFLMTPFVVRMVQRLRLGGPLFLIAVATSANIGSVMTIIGNPQTILVGSLASIPFSQYFLIMAPVGLVGLGLNRLLLPHFFPMSPAKAADARRRTEWLDTPWDADLLPTDFHYTLDAKTDRGLLLKCAISMGIALIGLFAGLNVAWTAMAAAGFLLLVAGWEPRQAFMKVDWQLLLFVSGLFIVVGGVRSTGASDLLYEQLHGLFGDDSVRQNWVLSVTTVVASNIVGNLPFVIVAGDWMPQFLDSKTSWMILAMASTFSGNLMMTSSLANILVRDAGKGVVQLRFGNHLRYGVVITLLTVGLGTSWILLVSH